MSHPSRVLVVGFAFFLVTDLLAALVCETKPTVVPVLVKRYDVGVPRSNSLPVQRGKERGPSQETPRLGPPQRGLATPYAATIPGALSAVHRNQNISGSAAAPSERRVPQPAPASPSKDAGVLESVSHKRTTGRTGCIRAPTPHGRADPVRCGCASSSPSGRRGPDNGGASATPHGSGGTTSRSSSCTTGATQSAAPSLSHPGF